eukprot:365510-Chlamydomonas_euryale.AAC.7
MAPNPGSEEEKARLVDGLDATGGASVDANGGRDVSRRSVFNACGLGTTAAIVLYYAACSSTMLVINKVRPHATRERNGVAQHFVRHRAVVRTHFCNSGVCAPPPGPRFNLWDAPLPEGLAPSVGSMLSGYRRRPPH